MNSGVIAMRYAKALLAFAKEHGAEDEVYGCMKNLQQAVSSMKELPVLLRAPRLSGDDRVAVICRVMGGTELMEKFARLIVKEQREELLPQIAYCYAKLYCSDKSLQPVKLTTARPLDDALKEKVTRLIAERLGKKVELSNVADSSIIGGYIYEAGSRRIDASVSGRLREVKKQLVKQNRKLV